MKIKTAEEFLKEHFNYSPNSAYIISNEDLFYYAIEFAKYHVTLALQSAAKKPVINLFVRPNCKNSKYKKVKDGESYDILGTRQMWKVDKESILNTYPLNNIQ